MAWPRPPTPNFFLTHRFKSWLLLISFIQQKCVKYLLCAWVLWDSGYYRCCYCCWITKLCLTATLWTAAHQASLSVTVSLSFLKFMSVETVITSNHLILCRPLLLLPSVFPSIGLFQWIDSSHQVTKVLELQHQSFQWIFRVYFL